MATRTEKSGKMGGAHRDFAYRKAAKRLHHRDGECEIDDGADVGFVKGEGAYVVAWILISDRDVTKADRGGG